ncbi:monovalent cation/H(+) antiporter subunit G [Neogemmobacter tilapiae]|uniref:Cation:proton antiporter n=1 Tax=Neogemmobacter tilapiae TaxID=875041 RepID=A0A918WNS1_9RHOB|nr:monovalent cation/H(+) antiporter subunit G [Gemmobacter tilapiae]GHC60124.1 cation:proton antiporter [Gemmobacter tilapiae]
MTPLDTLPVWLMLPVGLLLVLGSTLTLLGAFGLLNLRSFYDRIHAPTLGTSWGTAAILLASILSYSWLQDRLILHELVAGIFVMLTTPVTLMLLGQAALHRDRAEGDSTVPTPRAPVTEKPVTQKPN